MSPILHICLKMRPERVGKQNTCKKNMHLPPLSRFCHNQDISQFSAHLTVSVSQFFVTQY